MKTDDNQTHIPSEGAVDDRNTSDGQLIGTSSHHHGKSTDLHLKKYLSGMAYPATKQDLYDYARQKGASSDLLEALSRLKADDFRNFAHLQDEVSIHAKGPATSTQ